MFTDRRWLFSDHQGTIIAHTDGAGATTRYAYGPYGEPDAWGTQATHPRFRYTGQIALPEAQLYHYKARVYDPVLGRFLQTDPVGYEDDLNLYAYVRNDPGNAADPTGECRDRKEDGSCDVINNASRDRRSTAAERQAEARLTRLDRLINRLADDAQIGDMTGAEAKEVWNNTRWIIDPAGTDYGNDGVGAATVDSVGGVVRLELEGLLGYQSRSRGQQNYQLLHDSPGHTSPQGREDRRDLRFQHRYIDSATRRTRYDSESRYFREEERRATERAEALARAIGQPFEYDRERGY